MIIQENGVDRNATAEEEEFISEQLEIIANLPAPLSEQVWEIKEQQLDIAEAVVTLYETITIGVDG